MLKALGADSNAFTNARLHHLPHDNPRDRPGDGRANSVGPGLRTSSTTSRRFRRKHRPYFGEYNKSTSSPFLKLSEVLQNAAYTTHTYKHTTIGFLDDIKDMPNQYAYSKIFFNRWYRPENCTIIVAGGCETRRVWSHSQGSITENGSAGPFKCGDSPSSRRRATEDGSA